MHVRSVLNNHLLDVWMCLLRSSVLLVYFSLLKSVKAGGPFPWVYSLCWINGDVTPATGAVQYVISPEVI